MAQLKTDEWPDENEQTTAESQVDEVSPEPSILPPDTDVEARRRDEAPPNTGPDEAID